MPRRRALIATFCAALTSLTLGSSAIHAPLVFWNVTASVPRGLYVALSRMDTQPGQLVAAWLPPTARRLAAARGYLPLAVPLIKPIAAVAGATVCALGTTVFVNGVGLAERLSHDHSGREMPSWNGCRTLTTGEVFLVAPGRPDSFDGRYFGVTRGSEIIAVVRPVWTY